MFQLALRQKVDRLPKLLAAATLATALGCGPADLDDEAPTAAVASAISVRGTATPAQHEVFFCSEPAFAGTCELIKTHRTLRYPSPGDLPARSLSSLKVGQGLRVTLCAEETFAGTCQTFDTGNHASLAEHPIGDNATMSVRIDNQSADCRTGDPTGNRVYLYRWPNFGGDCIVASAGMAPIDASEMGMGDNLVSSVKVGPTAGGVVLYDTDRQRGERVTIATGQQVANLATLGFDDRTSSFRVLTSGDPVTE